MARQDYKMKIQMLLDTDHYKQLNKDPITTVEKQTRDVIKESSIPKEEQRRVLPSQRRPPRLYGLPKIHKPGNPLRLIVSTCTYELAKYVAKLLAQYSGNTKSFVKNYEHFIEILQYEITKEDLLLSFNINVPVEETLEIIKVTTNTKKTTAGSDKFGKTLPYFDLPPMERRILRTREWCCSGISSITCHPQHLYES
ncbi:hypothetical protein Trydic_g11514 [Trypoxylus dichotomus]